MKPKVHPDKVLEYINWFIENEILKYGGAQKWSEREECRCGPGTCATILQAILPPERMKTEGDLEMPLFLDCRLVLDPYYPEGVLVFWPPLISIPDIPFVVL